MGCVTIAIGREASEQPRARVREALVVDVDRILRREHDAEPERARLFEQREHRALRRGLGDRWEVAGDLVHVEERAQRRRALLGTHPANELTEQHRHEELPIGIGEMRDGEDREARPPARTVEQRGDVERRAIDEAGHRG